MGLRDELDDYVQDVVDREWTRRDGRQVPDPDDLPLRNVAVELEATVLYADIAGSTSMVNGYEDWFAAEVYKSYLYCAAKLIRAHGGTITAYDGDRVMGVFIGDAMCDNAAITALKINWVVDAIVNAKVRSAYSSSNFELRQRVGIDTSNLFVTRTGIRGSNDLVWVGNAANNAAKMAALNPRYSTYITRGVYERLGDAATFGGEPRRNMWVDLGVQSLGYRIYGSTYWWSV